jgi:hypothetical protein
VYEALKRAQEHEPLELTLLIAPNVEVRLPRRTREVDFLAAYQGRVGAAEVDGRYHADAQRWAADKSKDDLLRDAGVALVERIVVEDTSDRTTPDLIIRRFLRRLANVR